MTRGTESRLDVLYILQDFPVRSERFVEREIAGLLKLGARVRVATLAGNAEQLPTELQQLNVWRPPKVASLRFWRCGLAVLITILRQPRIAARLVARSFSFRSEASRLQTFYAFRWLPWVSCLATELQCDRPSIIHAHFASAPATVALLLGDWLARPWGFSVHAHDHYAESIRLSEKAALATHVFACSKTLATDVRDRIPAALRDRVHTIFHGIDLDFWRGNAVVPDGGVPRFLGVGRFVPKKGFDLLIRACAILQESGFEFRCTLIGDGTERDRMANGIESAGLGEVVRLLPWCSPEELRGHYRRASALVVPSVIAGDGDRDNIPNVIVEALACQLPVVAAAQPAIRETLEPRRAAMLFEPGDAHALAVALRAACTDQVLRAGLRESGLRLVRQHWDIRSTARQVFDLLDQGPDSIK